ncbi:MAG: hypothetical protein V1769_01505, partial [Thermoplasmatota archaeon]
LTISCQLQILSKCGYFKEFLVSSIDKNPCPHLEMMDFFNHISARIKNERDMIFFPPFNMLCKFNI